MNSSNSLIKLELAGGYILTIDDEAKAAYLSCKEYEGELFTHPDCTGFNVDFDVKANLIGIEVLDFDSTTPPELFALPGTALYKAIDEMNTILKARNLNN